MWKKAAEMTLRAWLARNCSRWDGSAWGGIDACRVQDLPDGRCGDAASQTGQIALDTSVAPAWVFAGQVKDETLSSSEWVTVHTGTGAGSFA